MIKIINCLTILFAAVTLTTAQAIAQTKHSKKMQTFITSGHTPVNGINMYYEVYGKGEIPLILIHGGGSTIQTSFENIIPFLATDHKVIAVELQAHGRTTDRNAPETFEQDADDVAGLLKALNIPKANIMGFSNGGTTTLQIAIRHPELVNKIIVIAGSYRRDGFMEGFFGFMDHASIDNMPQQLKDAFLKVTPDQARLQTMFEKDKARMINFKDINDSDIHAIKAPALFVVADKDVITIDHTIKMSKLVEGAGLIVVPGIHGSYIGEAGSIAADSKLPQATAIMINEFLSK
jgi:pimeloyl-ACP methyl ester carboxylesterase